MTSFVEIKDNKEFLPLNSKRDVALVNLTRLKENLDKLPKDKPSVRSFERYEAKIESLLESLENASDAITDYFSNSGGDPLNDEEFHQYCNIATTLTGNIEIIREGYFDLLKSKGLLAPPVSAQDPSCPELLSALKALADSSGKHADATEKQALAAIQSHKTPVLPLPTFSPNEAKADPLAWTTFWSKFEHFCKNCVDEESKLGFLFSALKGDALKVIKGLTCSNQNYQVAVKLLEEEYNNPKAVKDMLILRCLNFRIKNNTDFSEYNSAIINLRVQISELSKNYDTDVSTGAAAEILRVVIHDALPGNILSMYQSLAGTERPSLQDFLSKSREVADRLTTKQKNKQKNNSCSKSSETPSTTKASSEAPLSTIPASITAVGKNFPTKRNPPRKKKTCFYCSSESHIASRCPKFPTVSTRMQVVRDRGGNPCKKCIISHDVGKPCLPCGFKACKDSKTDSEHGILACPMILSQLKTQAPVPESKVVKVTTQKKVCSVALPTLTAQIESSATDKSLTSVACLLDTAAQTSLIHRDVVERLKIEPFRQEFTTLVGFNMARPVAKNYDVVKVKLVKAGYSHKVTLSCLVIDKNPAICNMMGVCQLAKKLHKKGADIADARLLNQKRDVLTADILIGADYFMSVVCSNVPPTRLVGNYLLNTGFGQCIIGKIPGSTKLVDPTAINQLTVNHVATTSVEQEKLIHPGLF